MSAIFFLLGWAFVASGVGLIMLLLGSKPAAGGVAAIVFGLAMVWWGLQG